MDEFEKSFDIAQDKFYNKALRFLSFRPRSEKEVRQNLQKFKSRLGRRKVEQVDDSLIDRVIDKLKEHNFLNDVEFAKWWIEQRTTFRPRSSKLIKIELRQKGIESGIIDEMINDLRFKNYDLDRAKELVSKKLDRYKQLSKEEKKEKLAQFLARKGFDWETIKQAIDEVL